MSERRMTGWRPDRELTSLLDALTEDLLGARDWDLVASGNDEAAAVRRVIAAAESDACLPRGASVGGTGFVGPALRAFVSRHQ